MIIVDTDHLTVLQYASSSCDALIARLESSDHDITMTIISAEELMRGWMAAIRRHKDPHDQIVPYKRLQILFELLARWPILAWDEEAADEFTRLRKERIRLGTMDLKIASIAITKDALVLSNNLRDFQNVPSLSVETWIT